MRGVEYVMLSSRIAKNRAKIPLNLLRDQFLYVCVRSPTSRFADVGLSQFANVLG